MKTPLLLSAIFLSGFLQAQEYCTYNAQTMVNFGFDSNETPYETIELDNGRYIIVGTTYYIAQNRFYLTMCRMNADDTIDPEYGINGRFQHTWEDRTIAVCADKQADGKILVGGFQAAWDLLQDPKPNVGRINTDGSIDTTFGSGGSAELDIMDEFKGTTVGVKELGDGKILAASITKSPAGIMLTRLNPDGSYDTSFNGTGYILHQDQRVLWQNFFGDALFMDDGSVVLVTKTTIGGPTQAIVFKFDESGEIVQGFGTNGSVIQSLPVELSFAGVHGHLDGDQNLLIGSTSESAPKKYQVAKYSGETGELDLDFGEDGVATSTNTSQFNKVRGMEVDPSNGDIFVVGSSSESGFNHSIWKIDSGGSEVNQCDGSGMLVYPAEVSNGLYTANFFEDGTLKLVGKGSVQDETTPDDTDQDVNFSILKFALPTGFDDLDQLAFSIYPNPARDYVNVELNNSSQIESVRIRNSLGEQVLQSSKIVSHRINIAALSPGIYLMEINSKLGRGVRKFVKL